MLDQFQTKQSLQAAESSEIWCCTCSAEIRSLITCVNMSACSIEPNSNSRASLESFTSFTTSTTNVNCKVKQTANTPHRYGNSCHMVSHGIQYLQTTRQGWHSRLWQHTSLKTTSTREHTHVRRLAETNGIQSIKMPPAIPNVLLQETRRNKAEEKQANPATPVWVSGSNP